MVSRRIACTRAHLCSCPTISVHSIDGKGIRPYGRCPLEPERGATQCSTSVFMKNRIVSESLLWSGGGLRRGKKSLRCGTVRVRWIARSLMVPTGSENGARSVSRSGTTCVDCSNGIRSTVRNAARALLRWGDPGKRAEDGGGQGPQEAAVRSSVAAFSEVAPNRAEATATPHGKNLRNGDSLVKECWDFPLSARNPRLEITKPLGQPQNCPRILLRAFGAFAPQAMPRWASPILAHRLELIRDRQNRRHPTKVKGSGEKRTGKRHRLIFGSTFMCLG